jgi:methylmalonyl-CoA/ethylmalonyl-CoA epimerase
MNTEKAENTAFKNLFQIGVVVKDMDQAIERLAELGIGPFKLNMPPAEAKEMFRGKMFIPNEGVLIKSARIGNVELELIQPVKGDSPHKEFLDAKGEGIHHVAFHVDDLDSEVDKLTEKGAEVLIRSDKKLKVGIAYLDLHASGLIVELVKHQE